MSETILDDMEAMKTFHDAIKPYAESGFPKPPATVGETDGAAVLIGAIGTVFVFIMVLGAGVVGMSAVIFAFFTGTFLYLWAMMKLGGVEKYRTLLWGKTADLSRTKPLSTPNMRDIQEIFAKHHLPPFQRFLTDEKLPARNEYYDAVRYDLEHNNVPDFVVDDGIMESAVNNQGIIGLFFMLSIPFLFITGIQDEGLLDFARGSWAGFASLILIEDILLKGVFYLVPVTVTSQINIKGHLMPTMFSKGVVVGCAYSCWETFARLGMKDVNPFSNLAARFIIVMPLQVAVTGLMFAGFYMLQKKEWKGGVLFLGAAFLIHIAYDFLGMMLSG